MKTTPLTSHLNAPRALTVKSAAIPQVMGQDMLEPLKLNGTEGINQLFEYSLTLQTPDSMMYRGVSDSLELDDLLGKELSCHIELEGMGQYTPGVSGGRGAANLGAGVREINGLITDARFVGQANRHAVYELTLRPWLHLSTLRSDCKVFQNMTPVAVIESILGNYGFAAEKRLIETYPVRDYCVQHNESDFEFLSRLFEENGISYFFEHSAGVHRLIYSDHNGAYQRTQKDSEHSAYKEIPYYPPGHKIEREYIHQFSAVKTITSGAFAARDYDYTQPRASLEVSARDPRPTGHAQLERYLWRGNRALMGADYSQPNAGSVAAGSDNQANQTNKALEQGQQYARQRMELLRQGGNRAQGAGHIRGIVPGHTFTLTEYPHAKMNKEYIVLRTHFTLENIAQQSQNNAATTALTILSDTERLSGQWRVLTEFEVQPVQEILRPEFTQRKPVVAGMETAVVCGPDADSAQSNTYTDSLARVKVQFPWDRYGQKNHNSSCWVRVASNWAGNQLGSISIPRIGQEVVVAFLGGDPDLPIIIGSVHNQNNMPPWQLAGQQALTGIRSRELTDGGGNSAAGRSNHMLLDDTVGKIQVQLKSDHLHSQLSLGYITRIEDNQGRKDSRGQGFELRSDGHGAIHANWGLLVSTYGREAANAHILSMRETTQHLSRAHEQHKNMGDLAVHHLAQDQDEADAVQRSLKQQADDVAGNGHTREEGTFPELQAPLIVLSSPAGIESTTAGSTHQHSEQHHAMTSGKHISLASLGSVLSAAGKNIAMLANQALRLIAAKGKVQIQAQSNDMELLAQQVLDLIGKQGVNIKSDTQIRLNVGPHAIQMTPGQGIAFISPMSPQFHTAAVNLGTAQSMTQMIQNSPMSKFDEKLRMVDTDGQPYANWKYRLTRADGSVVEGVTDAAGHVPVLRHDDPEGYGIAMLQPNK